MLEIETTINPSVSQEESEYEYETTRDVISPSRINHIIFYAYYVFIHIFVFSMFESLFFWLYITNKEDEAIMKQIEDAVLAGDLFCKNINDDFDLTPLYEYQKTKRDDFNEKVPLNNTILLNGYLAGILLGCNLLMKYSDMDVGKLNIHVLKKQTPMFILLFLYEYLFFANVVYNYVPNSANKIVKAIFNKCT